jgi:hypothetical protein
MCGAALHQKYFFGFAANAARLRRKSTSSALPPDVRRGFASPQTVKEEWGLAPRPAFGQKSQGEARTTRA